MKSHYLHVGNNHLDPYLQSIELFKVDFFLGCHRRPALPVDYYFGKLFLFQR